ncbi:MAG TPA: hypothetical protein VN828_04500 [Acidobacteriaceae bacterium]|nr:hypothetical protein [Acidobacteriaceae bacterium]
MDGNRDKQAETGRSHLWAATLLVDWLEREGGNNKSRRALAVLASMTVSELEASRSPPISEVEQLSNNYFDRYGGSRGDIAAGRWLRRRDVETWWQSRSSSMEQWFRAAGSPWIPAITVADGGGRGNSTEYSFRFDEMPELSNEPIDQPSWRSSDAGRADIDVIAYTREPAEPVFWLRWLLSHPFPTRSWRGIILVACLGIVMVTTLLLWYAVAVMLLTRRSMSLQLVTSIAFCASIASVAWWSVRSLWELPFERITIAPELILSLRQIYAQLRLTRDKDGKTVRGWLSLVRHSATCPICSGTIEIREGKAAYPGRLVGRCSDNPREHVYSFDAVTLTGRLLVPR